MGKAYSASFCHYGIQGGALYLDNVGITFLCQKISIEDKYKKLVLRYRDIKEINPCTSIIVFPAVRFIMEDKEEFKFVVFHRKKFLQQIEKLREV